MIIKFELFPTVVIFATFSNKRWSLTRANPVQKIIKLSKHHKLEKD